MDSNKSSKSSPLRLASLLCFWYWGALCTAFNCRLPCSCDACWVAPWCTLPYNSPWHLVLVSCLRTCCCWRHALDLALLLPPTKGSLVRRTIIDDPLCDRCHEAHETPLHALCLWLCKEIDIVWDDSELWSYQREVQFLSFKELPSWLIVQKQNVELFAMTIWLVWSQRNQVRLNHSATTLH